MLSRSSVLPVVLSATLPAISRELLFAPNPA